MQEPYIIKEVITVVRKYNPEYGDDRTCECGHPYYRHFDSWYDMDDVGCKYCQCFDFKELEISKIKKQLERDDE